MAAEAPRSILKKPSATGPSASRKPDAREVAIQHARILQERKDIEAQILEDVILLSEFPNRTTQASRPDAQDAADFKSHVRLFQPSDYDDLIEERNVNGLCGYTLCRRPRRNAGPGGEWTLAASGQIVRRRDLEKWCSQACARRALYVKVQLNETAAWERAGIPDIEIELLGEDRSAETEADRTARALSNLQLEDQRQAAKDSAALAAERGEPVTASRKPTVSADLHENQPVGPPKSTGAFDGDPDDHMRIEGYKPRFTGAKPNT